VRVQLTSQETAPTRFVITVAVGRGRPTMSTLWLAPGGAWRETVRVPQSAAVTVVAYRGSASEVPYRQVYLAPRGGR
jgi:hypothetical protein